MNIEHEWPMTFYILADLEPGFVASELPCPSFEKYLYYLFAPTLIYRDEYPRYACANIFSILFFF